MKIPFIIHSDGIEEPGENYNALEGELKLNLGQFVGENAKVVKISVSDYVLSVEDVVNTKTIPLLHINCSSGDGDIFSLGQNPDVGGENSLTLVCGQGSNGRASMYQLKMMLDCSTLCQVYKATAILKPLTADDYLQNNPSYLNFPPINSLFITRSGVLSNLIEVVMGTPLEALFDDAFTKSEGEAQSSATIRITLDVPPSAGAYVSYSQNARGVLTNSNASVKYQNGYGGLKYDLVLDGAITPVKSNPIIFRNKDGIILKTKTYVVSHVGEIGNIRSGTTCLEGLIAQLSNPIYRSCYITPLPASKATLSGVLDIEILG